MTAKEELLVSLVSSDRTGAIQRLHDELLALGFGWKQRAKTMGYYGRANGQELDLLAVRPGILSFPVSFWGPRPQVLARAMSLPGGNRIRIEPGPFTSSQFSAGQLALNGQTVDAIITMVREVVVPEARAVGAKM